MIYTIIFYISLLLTTTLVKSRLKAINYVVFISFLYMGFRYDYQPDYMAYLNYFNRVANGLKFFESDHMEYGWYLLNQFFSPVGFLGFEFFISFLFAYAIGILLKEFVSKEYLPYVVLGFFSSGTFIMSVSAHRQYVVASIFIIAFYYLIYNKIERFRDLLNLRVLFYFVIIYLCSTLHSSAAFLYLVPFFYFIPHHKYVAYSFLVGLFATIFVGPKFLPLIFDDLYSNYERYEALIDSEREMEHMTLISFLSYSVQILFTYFILVKKDIGRTDYFILIVALLTQFFSISIFSVAQIFRFNIYLGIFTYVVIDVIGRNIKTLYPQSHILSPNCVKIFYGVWILWNSLKVLSVPAGTVEEYKTIFSVLL